MKISFELLPAKNQNDLIQIESVGTALNTTHPSYFSIASGVAGAPASMTLETTRFLSQIVTTPIIPHLTCGDKTKNEVIELLDNYLQLGVKRILVLRGNSAPTGNFNYASDLVHFIRNQVGNQLHIIVALDPNDRDYLKQKVDAGANSAITQFFYDSDVYAQLLEACQQRDIHIPIVPGILPITDTAKNLRLAKQCGVRLPQNILCNLEKFAHDPLSTLEYGIDVVTKLCQQLINMGAPGLHFFTLNNVESCLRILRVLHEIE